MAVTEVSSQSWFSRLTDSIKSVLVGLVLFVVSFPVFFWNEGRAVRTAKSLAEGASGVISVGSAAVDPGSEGKLVHMTGDAKTDETLSDAAFGVKAPAITLGRTVQMYQWKEKKESSTRTKLGGGTETVTTYTYQKAWDTSLISSDGFKETGRENPTSMPFRSDRWTAKNVTLGAFTLSSDQISKIGGGEPLAMTDEDLLTLPDDLRSRAKVSSGELYVGDPAAPAIGDTKVRFEVIKPHGISVIAVQQGNTFAAYQASAGDTILLVSDGSHTAAEMFKAAQDANAMMTWILRAVGFALMFFGLIMVFRPISVFGDVIPLIGSMLGAGLGLFAFLLSISLTTLTIGIAWVVYRPVLGVSLLVVAAGALMFLVMRGNQGKKVAQAA